MVNRSVSVYLFVSRFEFQITHNHKYNFNHTRTLGLIRLEFSNFFSLSIVFSSFSFLFLLSLVFSYSFPSSFQFSHFHFQYFSELSLYPFDRTLTRCCSLLKCTVKIPIELRVEDNTKIEFSEQKNHLTSLALFFFILRLLSLIRSFFLLVSVCLVH